MIHTLGQYDLLFTDLHLWTYRKNIDILLEILNKFYYVGHAYDYGVEYIFNNPVLTGKIPGWQKNAYDVQQKKFSILNTLTDEVVLSMETVNFPLFFLATITGKDSTSRQYSVCSLAPTGFNDWTEDPNKQYLLFDFIDIGEWTGIQWYYNTNNFKFEVCNDCKIIVEPFFYFNSKKISIKQ